MDFSLFLRRYAERLLASSVKKEALRFAVVGVVATALHYGVYWLLHFLIGVNAAYTVGYAVSFVANYVLSARFTFREKRTMRNATGFAAAHLFNYLLQMGLLNLFLWLGTGKALAPVAVYCIAVPTNFIIVRKVFKIAAKRTTKG